MYAAANGSQLAMYWSPQLLEIEKMLTVNMSGPIDLHHAIQIIRVMEVRLL